jgi:hypothetical protein
MKPDTFGLPPQVRIDDVSLVLIGQGRLDLAAIMRRVLPRSNVSHRSSATAILASHGGTFILGKAIVKPAAASGGGLKGPALQ